MFCKVFFNIVLSHSHVVRPRQQCIVKMTTAKNVSCEQSFRIILEILDKILGLDVNQLLICDDLLCVNNFQTRSKSVMFRDELCLDFSNIDTEACEGHIKHLISIHGFEE